MIYRHKAYKHTHKHIHDPELNVDYCLLHTLIADVMEIECVNYSNA